MLALYRSGRQGDAVAVFRRLRAALDEDLGIDPGPQLRDLETAILRQDRAIAAPAPAARVVVAAQLPAEIPTFTDRYAEAGTYTNLGESHRALADLDAARAAWRRALAILDELGDPGANTVRTELEKLDATRHP